MSTSWGAVHRWAKPLPLLAFRPSGRFLPTIQSASAFVISGAASYSNWALKSVADADPVVVAANGNYGSKQVISVTPRLYDYLLANVREPQILRELREETATMRGSQMQVSPDQAQLLAMLVQILGAERCIEVGVYTGYSSLAIALVLPGGGRLVACERDARSLEVAKRYYDHAGVSHKIDVKHGLAADTLKSMIHNGEGCSYDFAFVDAEKRMYSDYFELLLQLVRVGGIIVIDNVLWHGKVADPLVNDPKTDSIRNFNKKLMDDERVSISMFLWHPHSAIADESGAFEFTITPSGLAFAIKLLAGPKAIKGQLIKAHYVGRLEDGKVFNSNYNLGKPLSFRIGIGDVIKGSDQGILGGDGVPAMLAGLRIPPDERSGMQRRQTNLDQFMRKFCYDFLLRPLDGLENEHGTMLLN